MDQVNTRRRRARRLRYRHRGQASLSSFVSGTLRSPLRLRFFDDGQAEVDDFEEGDTWYFPRGHGHAIQNIGPGECHFLLGFDNGHFSEFGTFSITDWIARTPRNVLARNLRLPESAFAQMPQKELYIGPGRVPPAVEEIRNSELQPSQSAYEFRMGKMPARSFEGGEERIATSKEFPIQTTITANRMDLKPGALRELHWHPCRRVAVLR